MLENIKEIGIFMIAAQAVIHFSPGRQYEKYIKLVSSVIILFLFMKPFISMPEELERGWQAGMEQVIQEYKREELWDSDAEGVNERTVRQLEEEIKSRLNSSISDMDHCVKSVSLVLEEDASGEDSKGYVSRLQKVEIVMTKKENEMVEPVSVGEIVIGDEKDKEDTGEAVRYQEVFARILGIEPERVEVTCVGGW